MVGSRFAEFRRCVSKVKKPARRFLTHGKVRAVLEFSLMLGLLYFLMGGVLVLAFRTESYWMAVKSNSMKHDWDGWSQLYIDGGYDTSQFPFQSGFEKGDLLIIQGVYSVSEVAVGDVVIMDQGSGVIPLVHRLAAIYEENGEARLITRGDAYWNRSKFEYFEPGDVLGKVVFVIPKLGWISLWFQGEA